MIARYLIIKNRCKLSVYSGLSLVAYGFYLTSSKVNVIDIQCVIFVCSKYDAVGLGVKSEYCNFNCLFLNNSPLDKISTLYGDRAVIK